MCMCLRVCAYTNLDIIEEKYTLLYRSEGVCHLFQYFTLFVSVSLCMCEVWHWLITTMPRSYLLWVPSLPIHFYSVRGHYYLFLSLAVTTARAKVFPICVSTLPLPYMLSRQILFKVQRILFR